MKYKTKEFKCRICNEIIPCVFDNEQAIIVPRVASQNHEEASDKPKENGKTVSEKSPDIVLIYLTCLNFHGPFAYTLDTNSRPKQN